MISFRFSYRFWYSFWYKIRCTRFLKFTWPFKASHHRFLSSRTLLCNSIFISPPLQLPLVLLNCCSFWWHRRLHFQHWSSGCQLMQYDHLEVVVSIFWYNMTILIFLLRTIFNGSKQDNPKFADITNPTRAQVTSSSYLWISMLLLGKS